MNAFERGCAAVRQATADDSRTIAFIHLESSNQAYKGILPWREITEDVIQLRSDTWSKFASSDETRVFVYEDCGAVKGFVHFGKCRDDDLDFRPTAEIWAMYVRLDSWRASIGTQLMNEVLRQMMLEEFESISLWVLRANQVAVNFYEKLGFQPDGSVKAHFETVEAIRMVKKT